jgi:hypothetical protein
MDLVRRGGAQFNPNPRVLDERVFDLDRARELH